MKIEFLENSNTQIKKALFGDRTEKIKTFAIFTSMNPRFKPKNYSSYEDENTPFNMKEFSEKYNNQQLDSLKKYLKHLGLNYTKVVGEFGGRENSFIVYNISYDETEEICRYYGQQSFFWGINQVEKTSMIGYYETTDGEHYSEIEVSETVDFTDVETFYTKHKGFKFKISLKAFEDMRSYNDSIIDESEIENSLLDYVPFRRMRARKRALGIGVNGVPHSEGLGRFYKEK